MLTRQEVIAKLGIEMVNAVESENCEYSYSDTGTAIFHASVRGIDQEGDNITLIAVYPMEESELYTDKELGDLDWEIEGYEIV